MAYRTSGEEKLWGNITKKDKKGNTLRFVRKTGEASGSWVIVKKAPPKKTVKFYKGGTVVGDSTVIQGKGEEHATKKGWKIR